jgi:hypothetical protein
MDIGFGAGALAVAAVLFFMCKKSKAGSLDSYEKLLVTEELAKTTLDLEEQVNGGVYSLRTPPIDRAGQTTMTRLDDALFTYDEYKITHAELEEASGRFGKVLGRGAFATVYLGVLEGEKVAIKVDSPELLKQDKKTKAILEKQFIYEIETLFAYRHPNICALIAHCTERPSRILVYEFCEGGDLLDRITASTHVPLTWPQRLRIAVGIARGLAFLHSATPHPIVHRDVKVGEVMIAKYLAFNLYIYVITPPLQPCTCATDLQYPLGREP